ncbi:hypothetical protein J7E99_36645 [Streptomyces sp. ISL-44]|uniref:hypothetical protein n=1 Tax=Streptomyces sp. ISL-44 TaxID=2819184 RepID=UPI001BED2301|nr:hypothetical protein [Streptomyces sp. ISL-44]MBT2546049.1 hypothetical protein [Streptomyces sp. ISL-44]
MAAPGQAVSGPYGVVGQGMINAKRTLTLALTAAAAAVVMATPASADSGVNSNVVNTSFLQKIANHPTVLQNNGGSLGSTGNFAGSMVDEVADV